MCHVSSAGRGRPRRNNRSPAATAPAYTYCRITDSHLGATLGLSGFGIAYLHQPHAMPSNKRQDNNNNKEQMQQAMKPETAIVDSTRHTARDTLHATHRHSIARDIQHVTRLVWCVGSTHQRLHLCLGENLAGRQFHVPCGVVYLHVWVLEGLRDFFRFLLLLEPLNFLLALLQAVF